MQYHTEILLFNEENALIEEQIIAVLYQAGFDVHPSCSEEELWKALRSEPVDLVLVNTEMIRQDLIKCIQRIHSICADLPILLLTPNISLNQLAKIVNAGTSAYLLKPVSPAQMVSAIRALLRPYQPPLADKAFPATSSSPHPPK